MTMSNKEEISNLKNSGCFDESWYLEKYPDVKELGMDPAEHFLWIGVKIGRRPSSTMSNEQYQSIASIISDRADTEQSVEGVSQHESLDNGITSEIMPIFAEKYFNADGYLEQYKDIAEAGIDPYQHFLENGFNEGRTGSFFDNKWYISQHKDVRLSGIDGFSHYKGSGKEEKRQSKFIEIRSFIENGSNFYSNKEYKNWVDEFDYPDCDRELYLSYAKRFAYRPLISIIMPVYKVEIEYLEQAINSVINQSYSNLELCIADDCSGDTRITQLLDKMSSLDNRIKYITRDKNGNISESSNTALGLASGDFIGLMDHDDVLHPNAAFWIVNELNKNPNIDIVYTDEDKLGDDGDRYDPHFKSDFNYELFLTQNMISHFAVYRTSILKEIGGFRLGFEGSQDYDMTLRFLERCARNIAHVPRVLYHWRAIAGSTALAPSEKAYTESASILALREHVEREGKRADVTIAPELPQYFRVRFKVEGNPKVSIIIPTKDKVDLLDQCISSINNISTYDNYEIIIINNGSVEELSFKYFDRISSSGINVINDNNPFNYSRINNLGFSYASGDHICLMNNDIEIISPDWMEEMLSFGQWNDVGCVGARLWYPDDTLQHGGVIIGLGGIAGHSHKYIEKGAVGYFGRAALPQALSAVTAACLMVKASVFREVNGLDEGLSVAFNDVDFCLRVREAGYRNVWTPYAEMYHHESASRGTEDTPEKQARFNGEIAFMKNRWGTLLAKDPYYSPNLTIEREDFSFAKTPRVQTIRDMI